MELKLRRATYTCRQFFLLIVPYGIETDNTVLIQIHVCLLLIVPYGIETFVKSYVTHKLVQLLIVPYGIETLKKD